MRKQAMVEAETIVRVGQSDDGMVALGVHQVIALLPPETALTVADSMREIALNILAKRVASDSLKQ